MGWNGDFIEVLRGREDGVMGSLEARGVAEGDGRAFGKQSSSIYFLVAPHGGIRPAERRRSRLALTLGEREVISRGVTAHRSTRVDRQTAWPLTLDGEPGNEPQWRL